MKMHEFTAKRGTNLPVQVADVTGRKDKNAQNIVIPYLTEALGDDFTLLRNYPLPDVGVEIPLILVGPSGVQVIYASAARGIFRARGNDWLEMNNRTRHFDNANPNLVALTRQLSQAVDKYLHENGIDLPEIEPVLIFTEASAHIDLSRPMVRIVPFEGIERFILNVKNLPKLLDQDTAFHIVRLLMRLELQADQPAQTRSEKRIAIAGIRLTKTQWLILAGMVAFGFFVMVGLLALIFLSL
ncbi:MAG: NERD domain-containing protein [Anaerolineales bacterium]|nr:NERD domain-containing protein [Anaerolineales bacterium]